uniref:Uncharacterized protein n=1 Tax=Knipowitschia caucasica TaxID=637954 RepID=A0AAV2KDJ8_KNICA
MKGSDGGVEVVRGVSSDLDVMSCDRASSNPIITHVHAATSTHMPSVQTSNNTAPPNSPPMPPHTLPHVIQWCPRARRYLTS